MMQWEYKPNFRPLKWWLPELMNLLRLPDSICRKWRRAEVAEALRTARRESIYIWPGFRKELVARAPQKNGPAFLESWDEYADRRRAERGQPPIIHW